jgi:hypothetical protein
MPETSILSLTLLCGFSLQRPRHSPCQYYPIRVIQRSEQADELQELHNPRAADRYRSGLAS